MKIAIIGRSEILYDSALFLVEKGHQISIIATSKETKDYLKTSHDFKDLSKKLGAKFIRSPNPKDLEKELLNIGIIDIGVSYNYLNIIPNDVIDLFKFGILNAHGGDLPRYRGNACQAWAILNGEKKIGLCVHKMIGGELDNGDIISRDFLNIDDDTKITYVHDWMRSRTPYLFEDSINKLTKNKNFILEKQSLNKKDILRTYPRHPDDGKIDWKMSALMVLRLINASNKPYSGAFFFYNDDKIKVWDALILEDSEKFLAVPGQVLKIADESIDVACGEGVIRLNILEKNGKIIKSKDLVNSLRVRLK